MNANQFTIKFEEYSGDEKDKEGEEIINDFSQINRNKRDEIFESMKKDNKKLYSEEDFEFQEKDEDIKEIYKKIFNNLYPEIKKEEKAITKRTYTLNPSKKIKALKEKLKEESESIQSFIKNNVLMNEVLSFDEILKELDDYKSKIDSIIASDLFKSTTKNISLKNELKENLEKYNKITSELLKQVIDQKNISKNINEDKNIYNLYVENVAIDPELNYSNKKDLDNLIKDITKEIEEVDTKIGKWNKFKMSNSIGDEIVKMIVFLEKNILEPQNKLQKLIKEKEEIEQELIKLQGEGINSEKKLDETKKKITRKNEEHR